MHLMSPALPVSTQGQDLGWTKEEDELLAAVVHEFGENYRLVAEVLSPTAAITGTYRNFKACAERFKKLVVRRPCPSHLHTCDVLQSSPKSHRQLVARRPRWRHPLPLLSLPETMCPPNMAASACNAECSPLDGR